MSDSKFKTLVHYVCARSEENFGDLGSVKLNKILWLSDLIAYASSGEPITSETYIKRQHGPVPKTILSTLKELEAEGCLIFRKSKGMVPTRYISLKDPDISDFSPEQISLIDSVINEVVDGHSATSISDFSHTHDAWQMAKIGEEIPHHTCFVSPPGEIDENDIAWANEVLAAS